MFIDIITVTEIFESSWHALEDDNIQLRNIWQHKMTAPENPISEDISESGLLDTTGKSWQFTLTCILELGSYDEQG